MFFLFLLFFFLDICPIRPLYFSYIYPAVVFGYSQVSTDAMAQLTDAADYDVRRKVAEIATQASRKKHYSKNCLLREASAVLLFYLAMAVWRMKRSRRVRRLTHRGIFFCSIVMQ